MDIRARRAEVVRCWETMERFNPQNVPSPGQRGVADLDRRRPLPWHPVEARRRGPPGRGQVWRHSVYVGLYPLAEVDVLDTSFGRDEWGDRSRAGSSALAAFDVTDDGTALPSSLVSSSCAWATGRLLRPGPSDPEWLRGFEQRELEVKAVASGRLPPRPLALGQLESLRDELAAELGVAGVLSCRTMRVRTVAIKRRLRRGCRRWPSQGVRLGPTSLPGSPYSMSTTACSGMASAGRSQAVSGLARISSRTTSAWSASIRARLRCERVRTTEPRPWSRCARPSCRSTC